MLNKIDILDTTLRDGEQATQGFKDGKDSKLEIAHKLTELGVDTIEAGFPHSSPKDFEAVSAIAKEVKGPYIAALARTIKEDIDKAWEAIKSNEKPTLHVFTYMVNKDAIDSYKITPKEIMDESVKGVSLARSLIGDKGRVEFSAQNLIFAVLEALKNKDNDSLNFLADLYGKTIEAGADIINLPDTEGRVLPTQMKDAVEYLLGSVGEKYSLKNKIVSVHCHNDLGNAVANSIAAISAGATQIECTINGIGERAGNAALEEVVMNIWTHKEYLKAYTNIKTEKLNEISRIVSDHTGWDISPNKPIVGQNVFRHSSGIHWDGKEKGENAGKKIYEIFNKEIVGWTGESNQLTARSGKRGVHARLLRLGYKISINEVESKVMPIYTGIADEKKLLDDIDLRAIMDEVYPKSQKVGYITHSLLKETDDPTQNGRVTLEINGSSKTSRWFNEEGSLDSLSKAVKSLLSECEIPTLVYYNVRNVGKSHSATAEVTIVLSENGINNKGTSEEGWDGDVRLGKPVYIGRSRHNDVPTASIIAYVKAVNNCLNAANQKPL